MPASDMQVAAVLREYGRVAQGRETASAPSAGQVAGLPTGASYDKRYAARLLGYLCQLMGEPNRVAAIRQARQQVFGIEDDRKMRRDALSGMTAGRPSGMASLPVVGSSIR